MQAERMLSQNRTWPQKLTRTLLASAVEAGAGAPNDSVVLDIGAAMPGYSVRSGQEAVSDLRLSGAAEIQRDRLRGTVRVTRLEHPWWNTLELPDPSEWPPLMVAKLLLKLEKCIPETESTATVDLTTILVVRQRPGFREIVRAPLLVATKSGCLAASGWTSAVQVTRLEHPWWDLAQLRIDHENRSRAKSV